MTSWTLPIRFDSVLNTCFRSFESHSGCIDLTGLIDCLNCRSRPGELYWLPKVHQYCGFCWQCSFCFLGKASDLVDVASGWPFLAGATGSTALSIYSICNLLYTTTKHKDEERWLVHRSTLICRKGDQIVLLVNRERGAKYSSDKRLWTVANVHEPKKWAALISAQEVMKPKKQHYVRKPG